MRSEWRATELRLLNREMALRFGLSALGIGVALLFLKQPLFGTAGIALGAAAIILSRLLPR